MPVVMSRKSKSIGKVIKKAVKTSVECICPGCKETAKRGKVEVTRWPDTLVVLLEKQRKVADVTI